VKPREFLCVAGAAAIALASCGEGSLETMQRSEDDPTIVAPTVASFAVERRISLSWPEDSCADEYIVESASGSVGSPIYSTAYRGKSALYQEDGCADQSLHLYRLTKVRGERNFGPSDSVLGVGSVTRQDAWEPNDVDSLATDLGYEKDANLYYFRSYGGVEVQDVDWYSIVVPPRMVAYVVVEQTMPKLSGTTTTWMRFAMKGQVSTPINDGVLIPLTNYAYGAQTIAFEIFPEAADFIGSGGPQGGNLIDYTVRVDRIDGI
jgi:hypothetical protein